MWVLGLGGVIAASAVAVPGVYDTPAKVAGYAATVGASAVSLLMSGRQSGIDTIGGITANEISQVAQLGITATAMFLVIRHTRAEEESGRAELLRSTLLGRHAATLAALAYASLAALLIGTVTTLSMLAVGLDLTGCLAYGVGLTLLGTFYAAVSLVAAQLSSSHEPPWRSPAAPSPSVTSFGGSAPSRTTPWCGSAVRVGPGPERVRRRAVVARRSPARRHGPAPRAGRCPDDAPRLR